MKFSKLPAVAAVICLLVSAHGSADEHDRLGVADYLEFEQVNDPQMSPDGRQIVYTRRWVDQQEDRMA